MCIQRDNQLTWREILQIPKSTSESRRIIQRRNIFNFFCGALSDTPNKRQRRCIGVPSVSQRRAFSILSYLSYIVLQPMKQLCHSIFLKPSDRTTPHHRNQFSSSRTTHTAKAAGSLWNPAVLPPSVFEGGLRN